MAGVIFIVLIFLGLIYLSNWISSTNSKKDQRDRELIEAKKAIERNQLGIVKPQSTKGSYPVVYISTDRVQHWRIKSKTDKYRTTSIGVAEERFNQFIEKYFGKEIIGWNSRNLNGYIPDFTVESSNYSIAIEIDEPYTILDKRPIHTINSDVDRDLHLLGLGWSIVRFSEKQVVTQPINCCKVIAQTIDYILIENRYSKDFKDVVDLTPDEFWTLDVATQYARNDYRNKYLQ